MAGSNRIGGIITFKVDGAQFAAKGNFTYNLGGYKREGVTGSDGTVHGYKESRIIPFVEGEITDTYDTDIPTLISLTNSTVTLDLANGKSIVFRNAFYAHEGTGNTEEGNFPVRFEATDAEEVM
jgi:hypothetical protein